MQFFLYEIAARCGAIYLAACLLRHIRSALAERKVAQIGGDLIADLLASWSKLVTYRDATPIRYWTVIGIEGLSLAACFYVAVFGWSRSGA